MHPVQVSLPFGILKIKADRHLRDNERRGLVPVKRIGSLYFVWHRKAPPPSSTAVNSKPTAEDELSQSSPASGDQAAGTILAAQPSTTKEPAIYDVLERKPGWMITLLGNEFGPCKSVDDAAKIAIAAAEDAMAQGRPAEVHVHMDGHPYTLWANGKFISSADGQASRMR